MMPVSSDPTQQTYDQYAAVYAETNASSKPVTYLYDIFSEYDAHGRVLDVGCGHGRDTAHFARRGFTAYGIDFSSGLLALARQAAPTAVFCQGDMRHLPYGLDAFDALWVCASLLHVPKADVPAVLDSFRDVLRAGGIMYIGVKQGDGERIVPAPVYGDAPRFFAFYQAAELAGLVQAAGFRVLESSVRNGWVNVFAR